MSSLFVFALKGVSYPSKDITLTHKNVKTPARRFFDARGKDKKKGKDKKAKLSTACGNV